LKLHFDILHQLYAICIVWDNNEKVRKINKLWDKAFCSKYLRIDGSFPYLVLYPNINLGSQELRLQKLEFEMRGNYVFLIGWLVSTFLNNIFTKNSYQIDQIPVFTLTLVQFLASTLCYLLVIYYQKSPSPIIDGSLLISNAAPTGLFILSTVCLNFGLYYSKISVFQSLQCSYFIVSIIINYFTLRQGSLINIFGSFLPIICGLYLLSSNSYWPLFFAVLASLKQLNTKTDDCSLTNLIQLIVSVIGTMVILPLAFTFNSNILVYFTSTYLWGAGISFFFMTWCFHQISELPVQLDGSYLVERFTVITLTIVLYEGSSMLKREAIGIIFCLLGSLLDLGVTANHTKTFWRQVIAATTIVSIMMVVAIDNPKGFK
jgi:hypothetical protein